MKQEILTNDKIREFRDRHDRYKTRREDHKGRKSTQDTRGR